ncbi:PRC-barrel domain-containing protein [Halomonas korlensis]|uniref:PRC-barrel domain-containing protein n=1 Tax=Halomonas korlensis TaxID=463301 RepID=A0A1I7KAS7_9GAMM|nr:PRC-barrel domain-containing protein [Halomonas korlensis]SFU94519.1 PRC-barrel domain-containing protein [Halomonas korlensis]
MKRTALAIAIGAISAGLSMGTWAQDPPDAENQENQTQTQQPSSGQASPDQENDMEVQVEEQPADVQVDQEAPDVTVEQEPPEVTIEQPEPEVTIDQPEPNVEIQEAEPEVTVEDTGEPEVTVESSGEPEVTVEEESQDQQQQDQQQQDQQDQAQQQQETTSSSDSALMSMQVSDLEGMTVNNQDGEEIGEVSQISQHNQSGDLYVIVGVGGFLGIGRTEIAMALDEMEMQGEDLVLKTNRTQDEIEQSSEDYNEDDYTQVDSDMTLSEASSQ